MTKEELLKKLTECDQNGDKEEAHNEADGLLIEYINDPEIAEAFNRIEKWYA